MRGRKPDPGAEARGTARNEPPTDIVPVEYSGAISSQRACSLRPPHSVPQTKAVKDLWRMILQEVARHELRAGDMPLIEAMFVAKVRHAQAGAYVKKHGVIIHIVEPATYDEWGNELTPALVVGPMRNPMLKEERDQAVIYDRLAQRLGLSPESRIRLKLMQVAGASLTASLRRSLEELEGGDAGNDADVIDGEIVDA